MRLSPRAPFSVITRPRTSAWQRHDYLLEGHVCDDLIFAGSYNLSRSGEMNAENVLEIKDRELADRMTAFIDEVRARYPEAPLPGDREAEERAAAR